MTAELREALNAAGASPFQPKVIDPVMVELQRRYSPLVTAIPAIQWPTDVYNFNTRNQVASGGWVSDGGASPVANGSYVQNQFKMSHFQTVGSVTGYAQEVTQQLVNLRETEIKGSIRGMTWDVETAMLWANSACSANGARPQFDGLDVLISNYGGANQNAIDANGASLNLSTLDRLIDMVETNSAEPTGNSPWALVMSSTANSKIAQYLTPQQRFVDRVEIAPGLNVMSYRDIPILKSSFLQARSLSMGTVTATPSANGGSRSRPGSTSTGSPRSSPARVRSPRPPRCPPPPPVPPARSRWPSRFPPDWRVRSPRCSRCGAAPRPAARRCWAGSMPRWGWRPTASPRS